jgi:ABC-type metal ion transport system substrate-binding protein
MSNEQSFQLKKSKKTVWVTLGTVVLIAALGTFFYFKSQKSDTVVFTDTLKVHCLPAIAGEERLLRFVSENIAPDYGIKIEAVTGVSDSIQANAAVAKGDYAATIHQHQWWLKQVIDANGFELTPTLPVFQWGFGIYSDKYKSIDELPQRAVIAIPIDGANQGQALWLLKREGILELNADIEPRVAKIRDIAANPKGFDFREFDLMTLPRVLDSVDAAVGYIANFDAGKIPREKGLLFPPAPKTFASQLVIGTKFLNDQHIKKLQDVFSDPRIQEYLAKTDDPLVQGVLMPVSEN